MEETAPVLVSYPQKLRKRRVHGLMAADKGGTYF